VPAATQVPIAEGLFTWPSDDPHLIGSKCTACGVVTFPKGSSCPRCTSLDVAPVELPTRGTIWTFTVQGFLPKSPPYAGPETPETFRPYGVAYVDLGEVKVESRLTTGDASKLRIGQTVELRVVPFKTDEHGNELMYFVFEPVD